MERAQVLRKCDIFHELSDAQLQAVSKTCRVKIFEPGEMICKQDTEGETIHIIEDGSAGIFLEVGPLSQRQVQAASNFDAVGWSSMIEPHEYTAAVIALEKTKTLAIDRHVLTDLCIADSELGRKVYKGIARVVARRLRAAYAQLIGIPLPDDLAS